MTRRRRASRYARGVRWVAVALLAACGHGTPAREPLGGAPAEGISIAIYASPTTGYAVVDDRRWIEVAGDTVLLDRIAPSAQLASLVIEPLGGESIHVGACARERIDDSAEALASLAEARGPRPKKMIVIHSAEDSERFHYEDTGQVEPAILPRPSVLSPLVRCRIHARPGKHLVRVMQVTTDLAFTTRHQVTMTSPERAIVVTRFALETPAWQAQRAQVVLYDGVPGVHAAPRELVRGAVVLDGSTGILAAEPRELAARLRSIYDGAKPDDEETKPSDIVWNRESRHQVWVWLEMTGTTLAPGPIRTHVELPDQPARDIEVEPDLQRTTEDTTRWPLWIDEDLIGARQRVIERADGVVIADTLQLAVSNLGSQQREVWIEERLRPAKRRAVTRTWPSRPTFAKDVARTKLVLAPGATQRIGFTIEYEF